MKKIIMLLSMILMLAFSSTCWADYPIYLNGDPNYILCDGHMGTGFYLNKNSLQREGADSDYVVYTTFEVLAVPDADRGQVAQFDRLQYYMGYDRDSYKMYRYIESRDQWKYIDYTGPSAVTRIVMPAGEMAYYLCFSRKFYGQIRTDYGYVFANSFYNNI